VYTKLKCRDLLVAGCSFVEFSLTPFLVLNAGVVFEEAGVADLRIVFGVFFFPVLDASFAIDFKNISSHKGLGDSFLFSFFLIDAFLQFSL
jgi:hypothetical protein